MKQKPKTCAHCGEEFTPLKINGIYCSNTCRQYSYLTRKTGKVHGIVKKESINEVKPEVPALIVEEQEEPISINESSIVNQPIRVIYQFKEKKDESKSINTVKTMVWNYTIPSQEPTNIESIQKAENNVTI